MTACGVQSGAGEMNRTPDLLITNELLYRLSYTGFLAFNYTADFGGRLWLRLEARRLASTWPASSHACQW